MKSSFINRTALAIALMLSLGFAQSAAAWDCSYWEQHTNPNAECYKPPVDPSSPTSATANAAASAAANQAQLQGQKQGQGQAQGQGQTANGGAGGAGDNAAATGGDQKQGQAQTATSDQDQSQEANATNAGNLQSTSYSSVYKQVRQAPAAFAGGTNTTTACFHSVGFGVSSPVGGISFGKGRKSKDCFKLVLAQDLYDRGEKIGGDKVFCTITEVREALGEDCYAIISSRVAVPRADGKGTDYVTREEFIESQRRLTQKLVTK